jgi:hypothetical protein
VEDFEFCDEFCRFIQTTIPAVEAAELLLLFRGRPEIALTVEEAIAKLGPGISIGDAAKHLELLEATTAKLLKARLQVAAPLITRPQPARKLDGE